MPQLAKMARLSPMSMQAIQYHDVKPTMESHLQLNKYAPLPPMHATGGVLVKVIGASVNPVDQKFAETLLVRRLVLGKPPTTPGVDFVGRVSRSDLPAFKEGDMIFGRNNGARKHGSLAEYMVLESDKGVTKMPIDFPTSRILELGSVGVAALAAYQCLQAGGLPLERGGGVVFIHGGSGGAGSFGLQMAKQCLGCGYLITSCSGANVDAVKSLGADLVFDYRTTNIAQALKEWSEKSGRKLDLIVDNVGTDFDVYWQSHHYLKEQTGSYVQLTSDFSLKTFVNLSKALLWPRLLGGGRMKFKLVNVDGSARDLDQIAQWMVEGKVKTVISEGNRFELAETATAFERLRNGGTLGKIAIHVAD